MTAAPPISPGPSGLFERVAQAMDGAYYEWDPQSDKINVSAACARMVGVPPDEWTVSTQIDMMHPDDLGPYQAAMEVFFRGTDNRAEFMFRLRVRGAWRWFLTQNLVERDASGRVTRLTGASKDITAEKEQQAENRALIARQEATIEVLRAISASPADPQPVFELIARKVKDLYGAHAVSVVEYDGELLHQRALIGHEPEAAARLLAAFPRPPGVDTGPGRVVLSGKPVYFRQIDAESGIIPAGRTASLGVGSYFAVPLLHEDRVVGVLGLWRADFGVFNETLVEIAQAFAEQAVIAIAGAKTLRALRERDDENRALIARQQASIEVLKAISESPDETLPVFELIARKARALCGASTVTMTEYDGSLLHLRVMEGFERTATIRAHQAFPRPPGPELMHGRAILSGQNIHIRDLDTEQNYFQPIRDAGHKSSLHVPLMREGRPIGAIGLERFQSGGFSDAEVALVESFAEQASLAIASAATLRELRARTAELAERNDAYSERIAQQAATIDVLQAMSASPGDAQPVFEAIARRANEFCEADGVAVTVLQDGLLHLRTHFGATQAQAEAYEAFFPRQADDTTTVGRAILSRAPAHNPDLQGGAGYTMQALAKANGLRSNMAVPMLRDGQPIGAIVIGRYTTGDFPPAQVELLKTFAEQAAIASAGAETFRQLQERTAELAERNDAYSERIDHQAATIDVLKEMSASPGDAQPVFDLIIRQARDLLLDVANVALFEYDGSLVHLRTHIGGENFDVTGFQAYLTGWPRTPDRGSVSCRAILDGTMIHIRDVRDEAGVSQAVIGIGHRAQVSIPLLRDGRAIGVLTASSMRVDGISDTQIDLLKTFAEQAVIAISSAETYRALQERTAALAQRNSEFGERIEQQSATIDVLKVMSKSPDDTQPVFDLIAHRVRELCNGQVGAVFEYDGALVHLRSVDIDANQQFNALQHATYLALWPMAPSRESISCQAILDKKIIHVRDVRMEEGLHWTVREQTMRSQVSVPLLRDGMAIGAVTLASGTVGGFSESQVALLETFAEQAVIAITSVANFRALRERTAELTRSVGELQALEEVLRAVNSSLDLDTVLATIISRAVRLSRADEGMIYEYDPAEEVFIPKSAYGMTEERIAGLRAARIRIGETYLGRSALARAPVHVDDVQTDTSLTDTAGLLAGIHAVLAVPLLKDSTVIGGLVIRRRTEGGFPPSTVTLMQTFAGQCVLAIENARLFQELAERGEEARRARLTAEATLADLRRTQDRLVQTEKLASLGQLTAGIAHEIKNPLNFVNNFSELSGDLLDELMESVAPGKLDLTPELRDEIEDITATLKSNLEKIAHHGKRADSIVKNMLLHSRTGASEHRLIDVNATVEEALNLAYHGARAENPNFNITMEKDLDPRAGQIDAYPQELLRVMLNLIGNGFYAAFKRAQLVPGQEAVLKVTTTALGEQVRIAVRDNGTGIPEDARQKIFEPFFTTKPAGEGTGLGLSLSHDIVVKQHAGQLTVDSQIDTFTEFTILLPRRMTQGAIQ